MCFAVNTVIDPEFDMTFIVIGAKTGLLES